MDRRRLREDLRDQRRRQDEIFGPDERSEISDVAWRQTRERLTVVIVRGLADQHAFNRAGADGIDERGNRRASVIHDLKTLAQRDTVDDEAVVVITVGVTGAGLSGEIRLRGSRVLAIVAAAWNSHADCRLRLPVGIW